ncbi:MAG TPA: BrnA antitoxin family protein [Xanthobacteraceae bacterium]|jgi:uncharacterized protein (DUF4415 family)|nr:BrnA antitoxin family protein [Xanthobacteraceae bacterium]
MTQRFTWSEAKRRRILAERGFDLLRAARIFHGPTIVTQDVRHDYGETRYIALGVTEDEYFTVVFSPRAKTRKRVKTYSTSSLPGVWDDERAGDIRSAALDEIDEMARRGALAPTRPDAEEIELDRSFWDHARMIPPLAPNKSSVHLRIDSDVLDWFRCQGRGHLTRMNAVLRAYFEAKRERH